MKAVSLLSFAVLSSGFVIPDEQVNHLQHVEVKSQSRPSGSIWDKLPSKSRLLNHIEEVHDSLIKTVQETYTKLSTQIETIEHDSESIIDVTISEVQAYASNVNEDVHHTFWDVQSWLKSEMSNAKEIAPLFDDHRDHPPHGPPKDDPHHGEPDHPPHDDPPHHGPGCHRPGHVRSNLTVYQLISESNYTTKLATLINKFPDLVETLNKTSANYTVFAPTDRAFEKIPEHAPKPSEEQLKALLQYHISPDFYPAVRVLVTRTIQTLLQSETLGDRTLPQRLSVHIGLNGLSVNFYSRVIAVDIFGSNGVIHGVDSIILPPPSSIEIIDLLPSEFSTLELGLGKTGLLEKLNTTDHAGGTLFAPSNFAFQKLGPKINAFLFSKFGLKYLEALLKYHVVPEQTLYSDAYYAPSSDKDDSLEKRDDDDHHHGPPKGFFHVDLPTLLEDHKLGVNIFRYGRIIELKINGFSRVTISDGVAKDGVIHVVSDVLIPPKKLGGVATGSVNGEDMTLEEFKERLLPYVDNDTPELNASEWLDL